MLHLIHNLEIGGAQVILKTLLDEQHSQGLRPVVAVWKRGGPIMDELALAGCNVQLCGNGEPASWLATLRWLNRLVDEFKPHVIHAHMPDSSFWAGILSVTKGIPALVSYYSNNLLFHTIDRRSLYGRLRWALLRWGARRAAINVACSDTVHAKMIEQLGLPPRSVPVVYNGVAMPRVAPDKHTQQQSTSSPVGEAPVVLSVGRLEDIKGQYQLIECAPALIAKIPGVKVVIVGEGPRLAEWRQRCIDLGVADNVLLTGRVADPATYLATADVYVSPSHYEGISMGLLEAMSWHVPVIASRVHGNIDAVEAGVDGLFYPLDDIQALADTILSLLANYPAAQQRATVAHEKVVQHYSGAAMNSGYCRLYQKISSQELTNGERPS